MIFNTTGRWPGRLEAIFQNGLLKAKAATKTIDDTNVGKNHSPAGDVAGGRKRMKAEG
jgi:hypothetical protein